MKTVLSGIAILSVMMIHPASAAGDPSPAPDGQKIYAKNCASCHRNEDPKLGDKAAWKPLIAQGADALVASVNKGKGRMKPHGGKHRLTHPEIEAAVKYMMEKSK